MQEENNSIHDYEARLRMVMKGVAKAPISDGSKNVIYRFKDECFSNERGQSSF